MASPSKSSERFMMRMFGRGAIDHVGGPIMILSAARK